MKSVNVRAPFPVASSSGLGSSLEYWRADLECGSDSPTNSGGKVLCKQLSIREIERERAWEKRRLRMQSRDSSSSINDMEGEGESPKTILTDEDLNELRGSIELGFGFREEDGQKLCNTLPALDLYFAVNRQLSESKLPLPSPGSSLTCSNSATASPIVASPRTPSSSHEAFKLFSPGDHPQHVKTRLRHWAQAVACSLRQCS